MALLDVFKKKNKEEKPVNRTTLVAVRLLAVGYCLYCLWQIIRMYMEGGEGAPSIWLLLLGIAVLGGGSVFVAISTIRQVLRLRKQEQEELDAEDEELARQAELAQENGEVPAEDEEETFEDEE